MRKVLAALLVALAILAGPMAQAEEPTPGEITDYLFARYEPSAKVDACGDFTHKDPFVATMKGMGLKAYAIGGVSPNVRASFYHMSEAMSRDGLEMCITSAYRDDFRQAMITCGVRSKRAASHGHGPGGGYGHSVAMDIVSCPKEGVNRYVENQRVWEWIDKRGREFGLYRPYVGINDPAHVHPVNMGGVRVAKNKKSKATRVAHNKKYKKRLKNGKTKKVRVAGR